ncbi:unnamed protein product [Closterium sp. NIES-65]|nr:unnamed protein product [Closterium sp. NIES-65]
MIDPQWTPDSCASAPSNEVPCGFAPPASAPMDAALLQGLPGATTDTFTAVCVVPFAAPLLAASRQSSGLPSPGKNGPIAPFTISVVPQTAASQRVNGAAQLAAASDVLPLWAGPLHVLDVSTHAARAPGESYAVRPLFALLVSSDSSTGGGAAPCGGQEEADCALGPSERPLIVAAAASDDEWTAMAEVWKGGEGCGAEAEGGCEWDRVAADVKAQAQQLLRDCGLTGPALTIPGSPRHRHQRAQQIIAAAHHQWCSLSPAPLPPPPSARLSFPHRAAAPPAVSPRSPLTPCPDNGSDGSSKAGGWEGFKSGNAQGRSGMSGRAARTLLLAACCAGLDGRHLRTHSLAADPLDSAAGDQPSPLSAVPSALPSPCAVSPPPILQAPGSFRRPPGCSIEVPSSPAAEPGRASPGRRLRKLLSPVYSLGGSWFAVPRLSSATAPLPACSANPMTNRGCVGRESGAELRGRDEDWGNENREEEQGGAAERGERVEEGDGGEAQVTARGEEKGEGERGESEEEEEGEEEDEGEGEGQDGRELARSQTMRSLQRSASRRSQPGGARGAGQRKGKAAARGAKAGAKASARLAMARSASFRVYIETGKDAAGSKGRQGDGGKGRGLSRQNSAVGRKAVQEERGVRYVRQASQRERGGEAQGRGDENEGPRDQNGGAEGEEEEEPGSFRRAYSAPNGERSLARSKSMRRAQEGGETVVGSEQRRDNAVGAVSGDEGKGGGRVRGSERGEERSGERRGGEEQGELQRSRTLPSKPARSGGGREQAAEKEEAEWGSEAQREAERAEMEERAERLRRQLQQQKQRLQRQSSGQQQAARSGTDEQAAGLAKRGRELLRLASLPRQQQLDAQAGGPAQVGGARRGAKQVVSGATPKLRRTGRDGSFRVYLDLSPRTPPAPAAAAEDSASTQEMRRAVTHSGASEQTRAGGVATSGRHLDRAASMQEGGLQAQAVGSAAGRQPQIRRAVTHTGTAEERVMGGGGAGAAERRQADGNSMVVRRVEGERRAEDGEGGAEALRKDAGVVGGERERLAAAAAAARRRVLVIDIPDKGDLYPAPLTAPASTLDPSPTAAATPPVAAPSSARAAPRAAPSGQAGSCAFPDGSRQRAVAGGRERWAGKTAVAGASPASARVVPTSAAITPTSAAITLTSAAITPTSAAITPTSAVVTPSSRASSKPSPRPATLHAPAVPSPGPARALLVPPSHTVPSGPPAAAPPPRIQQARSLPPIREGVALHGLLHAHQRAARGPAFPPSSSAPLGDERMGAWGGADGGQEEAEMQWQQPQQQQGLRAQQGWVQEVVGGGEHEWQQWAVPHPHAQQQQQGQLCYPPDTQGQMYRQQQQQQQSQQQFYQPKQQAGFISQRWHQQQQQQWSEGQAPQPSLIQSHSFNPQQQPQQRQQQQWQQQQPQQGEWSQQQQPKRVSFKHGNEPASHLVSQQLPRVGTTPHYAPPQHASNMRVTGHSQQRPLHGPHAASARAQPGVPASSPRGGDASLTRLLSWNAEKTRLFSQPRLPTAVCRLATMNTWSWQDSLRQAATIRTLPHAWKDHFLPQQQQLDAQPPQPSEASFDKLLNSCNSSPAFSSRLALLNGAACASLPALEPLPRGAELVSVRASYDQFSPASSFSLSAAHCQPPVPSPANDAEPAAEFMRTDETQQGQRCEWEGEWRETDELMSPRSSTGSCCDPDDLDSLLEAPHAFGQLAWESEFHTQSSHSRSSSCDLALPPRHSPSASSDSRICMELLESASSCFAANPLFQLSSQCVIDGEGIRELVVWLLQQGSGHEHDMAAQLQQLAAVPAESEGGVQAGGIAGVQVDEQLSNAIRQVLLMQAAC